MPGVRYVAPDDPNSLPGWIDAMGLLHRHRWSVGLAQFGAVHQADAYRVPEGGGPEEIRLGRGPTEEDALLDLLTAWEVYWRGR